MKIIADKHIPFINDFFGHDKNTLKLVNGRGMTPLDLEDAEILIVRSITHVNEALLAGSKIKFVGSVTAGADHLDTAWLEKAGIHWQLATGFNAPPVADYVVCTIAALQKEHQLLLQPKKKAAVIGVGQVGRLVEERLRVLGFDVVLCDPLRAKHEADFVSTPIEHIQEVDLISLHVPLTRHSDYPTHHMINAAFLQRQKPGCVLLNASRGAVVDSKALLSAGEHVKICLDVWEHEPHIDPAVLEKTMIATPHMAGYALQSKRRGVAMIFQALCSAYPNVFKASSGVLPPKYHYVSAAHSWQEAALTVFNPHVMTTVMKDTLLELEDTSHAFDALRYECQERYEFGFTDIHRAGLPHDDRVLLEKLGFVNKA